VLWSLQFRYHEEVLTILTPDFVSVTNLMHRLLFIHVILQPSTCFDQYCAHPLEVTLYTCSIWYRHSLWAVVVFMRHTGTARTPRPLIERDGTTCCMYVYPEERNRRAERYSSRSLPALLRTMETTPPSLCGWPRELFLKEITLICKKNKIHG
jgi:hypothetical protein